MFEALFALADEIKTQTLVPASRAARAISMFNPCSTLYWFSNPPAAPLVVPKEEMKILGDGTNEESWPAHRDVSSATKVVSLLCGAKLAAWGVRREMVSTRLTAEFASRLFRIWVPWDNHQYSVIMT